MFRAVLTAWSCVFISEAVLTARSCALMFGAVF